ncbi:hypothetical protein ACFQ07_02705 [Actinomadura adrarensis]|uniref:Uncharacterized protein n=1 Tax=Actinomadura adrarensis TaxID=1819600 RepID=A0ABW3C9C1_9ACTN
MQLTVVQESLKELPKATTGLAKLSGGGAYLTLEQGGWPATFFPGIVLDMSWVPRQAKIIAIARKLDRPIGLRDEAARIIGRAITFEYDPQAVTRATAPGGAASATPTGLSPTAWVLRALQILGYLDEEGRVVLAEDALERNLVGELDYLANQIHRITPAVQELIASGQIHKVVGSLNARGEPVYPATPGRPPITLLSYSPFVPASERPLPMRTRVAVERDPHKVAGFVRRLPDGQMHSDEALDAHREAQRRGQVANRNPLPPNYTYVQPHRRSK